MIYLIIVSLIWALSFGLIKTHLGGLDSNFVAAARLGISLLVFLPLLRRKHLSLPTSLSLIAIGAVQYGVMYSVYIYAYRFLASYEVALFTIFTPLYVTIINDLMTRRFHRLFIVSAMLAVIGTAVIYYQAPQRNQLLQGFLLMQSSNICFAVGQLAYKRVMARNEQLKDHSVFALLYLGAFVLTAFFSALTTEWSTFSINASQVWVILYLGMVASGLGFFLWNYGARKVNVGLLAVCNNIKAPLAVASSMIFFDTPGNPLRTAIGGGVIIFAIVFNEYARSKRKVD
ncbi:MAG: EamA family transporter [Sedimentisphaerales bacterium]|nr:EamA family transporter [Sedimentisphaerales bacterium]